MICKNERDVFIERDVEIDEIEDGDSMSWDEEPKEEKVLDE